jgi:hypothetical protein
MPQLFKRVIYNCLKIPSIPAKRVPSIIGVLVHEPRKVPVYRSIARENAGLGTIAFRYFDAMIL